MTAELGVVRSLDAHAVVQFLAGRDTIGIVVHVAFSHGFVFFVVEHHNDDGKLVALRGAERLDDGVVEE